MPKFSIVETIYSEKVKTVRLGASTPGQQFGHAEVGKAVKLAGESQYVLCAAGDAIEGIISSSNLAEQGTQDGFAIGGIVGTGYKNVVFDGVQATPGTGTVAMGAYVVVGTVVPRATALTAPLRVTSATNQATAASAPYKARVVSLGDAGTGAVGTVGVVEMF
jgi:hypothetical protein